MSYPINFWYGIPKEFISRERIEEAAAAGFNIIECRYDTETNKKVLNWCEDLGIKAYLWDDRMSAAIREDEGWQSSLDEMIEDYKNYPALDRYFIKDEPVGAQFPMLQRISGYLSEHDKNHGFYINLLPIHAMPPEETYEEHVEKFLDMIKPSLLSYDHYCMGKKEIPSYPADTTLPFFEARVSEECRERNHTEHVLYAEETTSGYFNNLEFIRKKARERNIDWMIIILLSEHWHYRQLTEPEIRWEVFTALAYGSSQLSYFTYWTPGLSHNEPWSYHHALISSDGKKDENYYIVQRINKEIQSIMSETDSSRSLEVFHIGDEKDTMTVPFRPCYGISGIDGGNFVVGFFESGKMILVNKDFHSCAYAKIKTDPGKKLEKFSKSRKVWDTIPCSGEYAIPLSAGDGELFRIS